MSPTPYSFPPSQLDLLDYPRTPGWRAADTSIEAAEAIAPGVTALQARVLAKVARADSGVLGGLTADEAAAELDLDILTVRPRVTELNRQGRLHDSGLRRSNASGRRAIVWTTIAPPAEPRPAPRSKYEKRKGR